MVIKTKDWFIGNHNICALQFIVKALKVSQIAASVGGHY